MILFKYTLLFFALLSGATAAPILASNSNMEAPLITENTDKPWGWVYYAESSLWVSSML